MTNVIPKALPNVTALLTPTSIPNVTTPLLYGSLNPTHTSTISAYWVAYPTPWPVFLLSIAVSLLLGFNGYKSAAKSWPTAKWVPGSINSPQGQEYKSYQRPPDQDYNVEYGLTDMSKQALVTQTELRRELAGKGFWRYMWDTRKERGLQKKNATSNWHEVYNYNPEDDRKVDGGAGKFGMILSIGGCLWTTLRAFSATAVVFSVASGKGHDNYPSPLSVMLLFTSTQTYLVTRGMPRIFNILAAFVLILIYTNYMIGSFGPNSETRYFAKVGVEGGNCPYFDGNACNYTLWPTLGCPTNDTWDTAAHGYPRAAYFWDGDADPNNFSQVNFLRWLEYHLRGIGAGYGLLCALCTLPTLALIFKPTQFLRPISAKQGTLRRQAIQVWGWSFYLLLVLCIISIPTQLIEENTPPSYTYVDSYGPLIDAGPFLENGTAQFGISHDATNATAFLGGDSTSWSDCFTVEAASGPWGNLEAWWAEEEKGVLRAIGGI